MAEAAVETAPPELDSALLAQLGQRDPAIAAWLEELDVGPLLAEALARLGDVDARIVDGKLVSKDNVGERWQLELLRIVCELLDFATSTLPDGIEGEKDGPGGVHEYIAIRRRAGGFEIRFEHYGSDAALALDELRFRALAARLGVRVRLVGVRRAGSPIAPGTVHPHRKKH